MNNTPKLQIQQAPQALKDLYELAQLARSRSYSRYSGYAVGAAIRLADGSTFGGCNVENASYGATVCAERVAIQKAVSEIGGAFTISEIMVITDATPPWPPCGMCRQVIAEFAQDTQVYTANLSGEYQVMPFKELFPNSFDRAQINPETKH